MFSIRQAQPHDQEALYRICLETAASGQDATSLYQDPRIIGHIYAGPYLKFQPDFAFVLTDELGVCGYVLGTLDSQEFASTLEREWWPALREQYPRATPSADCRHRTPDEVAAHLIHHPPAPGAPFWPAYPSHLHIDLLPRAQGQGYGKKLMQKLFAALRAAGSPGVHLGVGGKNTKAQAFYKHLGMTELSRDEQGNAVMGQKF